MPVSRRSAGVVALLALITPLAAAVPVSALPSATAGPATVSVVVPITAQPGAEGLLDAQALETATSPVGVLTRDLDEVLATSATIALDPMILASIRLLGAAVPDSASDWLDRLEAAPNEVFLLAYADADLSALARADALDLASVDLGFAIDPNAFGPAPAPAPESTGDSLPGPTGSPDDGPPPLPTTEGLLDWPEEIGRIAWPSAGSAVATDLDAYAASYDAVLLSSANVSETANARVDLGAMTGLVADSAASELFRQASTSSDEQSRSQSIERLGVALDGLAAAHPGRSIILTLDRSASFPFPGLAETHAALVVRDDTRLASLSELLGEGGDPARIVDGEGSEPTSRAPALVDALRAEAAFATILDDPLLLTGPRRLELLALLGVSDATPSNWSARADEFLEQSAVILNSVTIVDTGDLIVTSSTPTIPIHVANGLDLPVTVRIDVHPLRPRIRIDSPVEVTVEPGSSKAVRLEAQAITNGDVVVIVSVSSPSTGVTIGQPRSFNVDLQAQWETVGVIVGALVGLIFAAGIVRNVVRRRRRAAAERAIDPDAVNGNAE